MPCSSTLMASRDAGYSWTQSWSWWRAIIARGLSVCGVPVEKIQDTLCTNQVVVEGAMIGTLIESANRLRA